MPGAMKTLELVFVDAGGGHRSAANSLTEAARREHRPWDMRLTNLFELLAELDFAKRLTGVGVGDIYNGLLRRGWTRGFSAVIPPMQAIIRLSHGSQVALLARHWRASKPDLVVSCIPHFNRALHDAIELSIPGVPLVTILTDLADYPPHFWIEERQRQYFICGTDRAREQALGAGHPAERVFQTSGMILNPRFYDGAAAGPPGDRTALGLDATLPTALMMFGGEGSSEMLAIARALDASGMDVQLIAVCGRNARLEARMRAERLRIRMHVVGFTTEVARLMRMSDFFIGKPGPGSISEALEMGLPVIVDCNGRTIPQERYNAQWVAEGGYGIAVRNFRKEIAVAVAGMLDPERRRRFVERVAANRNRAVFEIPEILEGILNA
jgi:UDP-N-acetylglucosamine:LPS N-acetylglucosamine transferase